jgi:hypothetical protein
VPVRADSRAACSCSRTTVRPTSTGLVILRAMAPIIRVDRCGSPSDGLGSGATQASRGSMDLGNEAEAWASSWLRGPGRAQAGLARFDQSLSKGLVVQAGGVGAGETAHLEVVHRALLRCATGVVASERNDGSKGWAGTSGEPFSPTSQHLHFALGRAFRAWLTPKEADWARARAGRSSRGGPAAPGCHGVRLVCRLHRLRRRATSNRGPEPAL